ncbi:hypothetical protein [Streptomyces sp. NPDC101166]|uniref:hypothetical protein n=1 Tax=Streptomyces sp. NPDC101166 TaxID=3366120 RepID=UPI0037F32117
MNTERPDNDDAARGPEDGATPEPETTEPADGTEAVTDDATEADTAEGNTAEAAAEAGAEPEADAKPKAGAEPKTDAQPKAEARPKAAEAEVEAGAEPEADAEPKADADAVAESDAAAEPATAAAVEAAEGNTAEAEAAAKPKTEARPETDAQPKTEARPETDAQPKAEARPDTDAKPKADRDAVAESDAVTESATAAAVETAPVRAEDKPAADAAPADRTAAAGGELGDVGPVAGEARGGRRRSPAVVAAVAAAVLLVGGGGAYLAANAAGGGGGESAAGSPSRDGAPPALVLDDYNAAAAPSDNGSSSDSGGNGIAPGEPNPYGVVYRAEGTLPDGPDTAPVYWAKGAVGEGEVARLAAALGVKGTPVTEGQSWKVGAGTDGSGPVLRVEKQAPSLWTFNRYAPGTDSCKSGGAVCAQGSASGDPVSEEAAKKAAEPVLEAVGQSDAEIDASQVAGAQRMVNADAEFGGLPTYGWTTGVTVNGQGEVVSGNGQLKTPAEGESYPVLSARETLDRMNAAPGTDRRMGIGGCASSAPLDGRPQGREDRLASPCAPSADMPGKQTRKQTVTVQEAVFGLAPHSSGGRQVLVPSWLFEVRGAGDGTYTVTHPAVEPEYLGTPATASPSGGPTSGATTQDVKVDGYTAEGRELTVAFTGGVCADYTAAATERGDRVEVTVTATPWPDKVCIKIAKVFHKTVTLDEPLGSRTVVGSDGKAVPLEKPGARLP